MRGWSKHGVRWSRRDLLEFERWVAIKLLKTHLGSAFERECKTLGRLGEHPRVVRMFHAGTSKSGSPYIVMEWLPRDRNLRP
jgi:serine/threonine protein kinase